MDSRFREMYEARKGTVQDCLELIRSGDMIAFAAFCNAPVEILSQLHTVADRLTNVRCIKGHEGVYPFVTQPGMDGHIHTGSFFLGKDLANGIRAGNCSFIPVDMCDYATFTYEFHPSDVFIASVAPMDENGNFQVGLSLIYESEAFSCADRVILEVNPRMPRVTGGLEINIADVDRLVEVDYPPVEVADLDPSPEELVVAKNVRSLMRDGDCIQIGIGSLPNAIANEMFDLRDLGLHTELMTNTVGRLIDAGVVNGERKNLNRGEHLYIFAGGSLALYDLLGRNKACRVVPAVYCADPRVIMQNDNMISVNTCVEIDLTGNICSESIGPRIISGSGGAFDYVYGAIHAKGGRSVMAFTSRTRKGVSKIVPMLAQGAGITVPRNYADYIVTEYGIAHLRGCSLRERAKALISIAHPDVRDELTFMAKKLFYI